MKKVLLLCPELFAHDGGIQRILRLYLRALATSPQHEEVRLVVLNDRAFPEPALHEAAGSKLRSATACDQGRLHFLITVLRQSAGVDRLVCGHIGQLPIAVLAKRFFPRLKVYLVAHGIEVWRPFSWLERRALARVEKVWCVSEYTRREIASRLPSIASRLEVVPNGLDPAFSMPAACPDSLSGAQADNPGDGDARVILTVGRLNRSDAYKGYDLLIQALPRIIAAEPRTRLRLVGSGDDEARLRSLAETGGVADAVDFAGRLTDERLRQEFAGCALFALPSTGEGFGLTFIEALSAGRPCVGVRAGAVPEILTPACGFLAEPGNSESIADACIDTLRKPWSSDALREEARRFSFPVFQTRLESAW